MADRAGMIEAFLRAQGWGGARRQALAGDASFRRYERLREAGPDGERRAVLMDAPPPQEDIRPFITVARRLNEMGFSAPEILAEDVVAGLLLLEDFGDDTYTALFEKGADERELYTLATDVLMALHAKPLSLAGGNILPYDIEQFESEHVHLIDWFLPAATGNEVPASVRASYMEIWRGLLGQIRGISQVLVLRDYHVDNLILLEGREGIKACGLLDFQDALVGPCVYDVVSLLEDARRDIATDIVEGMIARYLAAFPGLDREDFAAAYAILAAQRNCKIIGLFVRLCRRDGKAGYVVHLPRLWRLLEEDLRHPVLAPLKAWLDQHVPRNLRGIPACLRTEE